MMRVTPLRLTTLQCSQIGFTLDRTFTGTPVWCEFAKLKSGQVSQNNQLTIGMQVQLRTRTADGGTGTAGVGIGVGYDRLTEPFHPTPIPPLALPVPPSLERRIS